MDDKDLREITDWMRTTDLLEASYRRGGAGAGVRLEGEPAGGAWPACALVPVRCAEIGMFRAHALGSAPKSCAGSLVREGQTLGFIEVGARAEPVLAPVSGKIAAAVAEDGQAVQYGQALFFIAP